MDGEIDWQTRAGAFGSKHGYAPSPALVGPLVIVAADSSRGSFLAGLHRETGQIIWRTSRPDQPSFSSPIIASVAGKEQILLSGCNQTCGYDPQNNGKLLWKVDGPADTTACTMTFGDGLVFSSGGYPQHVLQAIRVSQAEDDPNTGFSAEIVWSVEGSSKISYVPSPLFSQGHLYVLADRGILTCYKATSGEVTFRKRLSGNSSASPVLIGDLIVICNEAGQMIILKDNPSEYQEVARLDPSAEDQQGNPGSPEEQQLATPVIANGKLYLRTTKKLYCLGDTKESS